MIGLVPAEKLIDYVGQDIGSSDWFEVDQDRINMFADSTLEQNLFILDEANTISRANATKPKGGGGLGG